MFFHGEKYTKFQTSSQGAHCLVCAQTVAITNPLLHTVTKSLEELDRHVLKILRAKQWIFEHLK